MNGITVSSQKLLPPLRYLLVFWLLVLSAVAYLDRTNISIAGVKIGSEFKIDHSHLGWIFSAFLIGYAGFQIPGGILVRRFGPRLVLSVSVVWWGMFTALTALVSPGVPGALLILIAVRFSLGAGEAIMYPAASQFVERWFPIVERGKANGIIFGGVGLGAGLTPPLITSVMLHHGWRSSFWLCAGVGILAGSVWYLIARDSPEQHPLVGARELELIARGRDNIERPNAFTSNGGPRNQVTPWKEIFSSKEIVAMTLSCFTYGYVAWIFFGWFYIYLAEVRGLDLKTSALYSMLPFIAMTLGCLTGGVASDWLAQHLSRRAGRCMLPAFALGCTAVLLVVGSRVNNASVASVVLACGAGVLYLSQSGFWAVIADVSGEYAGVASGLMNMGGQIGGAVTASLTPLIATRFGWNASFLTAAVLAMGGAFAWLVVNPDARLAKKIATQSKAETADA
jgi:ACS family glucarate transporter-like MFS transporter